MGNRQLGKIKNTVIFVQTFSDLIKHYSCIYDSPN